MSTNNHKSYILQAFLDGHWAILPSKLAVLHEIVVRHVSGEEIEPEEVEMRLHGTARPQERLSSALDSSGEVTRTVAILPLFGSIFPRGNLMTAMSGATSAEQFGKEFQKLVEDPEIDAIVMDVDSPGGYAPGLKELSDIIYQARGAKPIVSVANHTMASGAFWVASAADEIVVTPSGEVGSVGAFTVHQDVSKALEQRGVKITLISAGKYKVEGNPYEPLGDEAQTAIQSGVNETYEAFVSGLARHRDVSVQTVKNDFGEGRMLNAERAVAAGMADRIATLQEVVTELLAIPTQSTGVSSAQGASSQTYVNVPDEGLSSMPSAPVDNESPKNGGTELEAQAQRLEKESHQTYQAKETPMIDLKPYQDAVLKAQDDVTTVKSKIDALMQDGKSEEALALQPELDKAEAKLLTAEKLYNSMSNHSENGEDTARRFVPASTEQTDRQLEEEQSDELVKTREEFETLDPATRMEFIKSGGKVVNAIQS